MWADIIKFENIEIGYHLYFRFYTNFYNDENNVKFRFLENIFNTFNAAKYKYFCLIENNEKKRSENDTMSTINTVKRCQ